MLETEKEPYKKIIAELQKNPGMGMNGLMQVTGMPFEVVYQALVNLAINDMITFKHDGGYVLQGGIKNEQDN